MSSIRGKAARKLENEFQIDCSVLDRYDEPHRFYHTWEHIEGMLDGNSKAWDSAIVFLAIIFHDIVYDPKRDDNEQMSANFFKKEYYKSGMNKSQVIYEMVRDAILETKAHKPTFEESSFLCNLDLAVLDQKLPGLLKYEEGIFKEYQYANWADYQEQRIQVLQYLNHTRKNPAIDDLIEIVRNKRPNIGIYAGSFNPFHVGHLDILLKAEQIFDKVIIARGVNTDKDQSNLYHLPKSIGNREVVTYDGLLTDFIKSQTQSANYTLIRGLRNGNDLQYEMNQYRFLQDMYPEIKVIQILCNREFEHISSSAIRSLIKIKDSNYRDYLIGEREHEAEIELDKQRQKAYDDHVAKLDKK